MNLRNFSIAARLAGGFALIALLVVLLGTLAMREMSDMRDKAREVEQIWMPSIELVAEFGQDIMRIRTFTLRMLLEDNLADRQQLEGRIVALIAEMKASESEFASFMTDPDKRRAFDGYLAQREEFMAVQKQVAVLSLADDVAQGIILVDTRLSPLGDAMVRALKDLESTLKDGAEQAGAEASASYASAQMTVVIFIVVAALLTVLLAWILTRSIVVPIRQAVEVTEVVAAGDLTRTFSVTGKDEPARLLRALSGMQTQLRETIQGIGNSSTQLASAAEELNAVTEDATRGLQRQNDEIQQAATAVNEMSTAVDEVASNAVSTSEQSRATSATAEEGQQQVARTVTSIDKLTSTIESTSSEVQELAEIGRASCRERV